MSSLPIRLIVNDRPVQMQAEPRILLGDFLRDELRLTGLHLACEHGVCGACNVEVDGSVSRSCTQLAVACDGRRIRTIEGFGEDLLMERLRTAFSIEHALQCGYCTPGMLMTAHEIVRRFPRLDEESVRRELSGNLCRCTGYAGIVRAILRVSGERDDWSSISAPPGGSDITARAVDGGLSVHAGVAAAQAATDASVSPERIPQPMPLPEAGAANIITREFVLPMPLEDVWRFFGEVATVAACMPGLEVEDIQDDERLRGIFTVKVGPIRAVFATIARITRDAATHSGRVESEGRDRLTRSLALARLDYRLLPNPEGGGTTILITARFHIEGRLAEFSRPEVVAALAAQLTERFAANVEQYLAHGRPEVAGSTAALSLPLATVLGDGLRRMGHRVASLMRRLMFWR